jgi:acyl dehydratase
MGVAVSRNPVNYGVNRIRFTAPVPSGLRIRLRQGLKASEPAGRGDRRLVFEATVEVEGTGRPALVAETITLVFA